MNNLKDDWTFESRTPSGSVSQSGTGETLWVYDYQPNGTVYTLLQFSEDQPSGPGISNARQGSIGGPAFGFVFGIKYKL